MEVGLVCWRTLVSNVKENTWRGHPSSPAPRLVFKEQWAAYQVPSNASITNFSPISGIRTFESVSSLWFQSSHTRTENITVIHSGAPGSPPTASVAKVPNYGFSLHFATTITPPLPLRCDCNGPSMIG